MTMLDLGPAAREVATLVNRLGADDLVRPTPCDGMSVAALLDHFMGLSLAFTWAARKTPPATPGPRPGSACADSLDPEWRTKLPLRLEELVEAWRDRSAWTGMTEAGGVTLPAAQMGMVALDELVLHGWDLAVAVGKPFACDAASAAAVLDFTRSMSAPEHAESLVGLFGPVVPVVADAGVFEQALGYAGRDPRWRPPADVSLHRRGLGQNDSTVGREVPAS